MGLIYQMGEANKTYYKELTIESLNKFMRELSEYYRDDSFVEVGFKQLSITEDIKKFNLV